MTPDAVTFLCQHRKTKTLVIGGLTRFSAGKIKAAITSSFAFCFHRNLYAGGKRSNQESASKIMCATCSRKEGVVYGSLSETKSVPLSGQQFLNVAIMV